MSCCNCPSNLPSPIQCAPSDCNPPGVDFSNPKLAVTLNCGGFLNYTFIFNNSCSSYFLKSFPRRKLTNPDLWICTDTPIGLCEISLPNPGDFITNGPYIYPFCPPIGTGVVETCIRVGESIVTYIISIGWPQFFPNIGVYPPPCTGCYNMGFNISAFYNNYPSRYGYPYGASWSANYSTIYPDFGSWTTIALSPSSISQYTDSGPNPGPGSASGNLFMADYNGLPNFINVTKL